MSLYLCNKSFPCQYYYDSKYCLMPWAKEELVMTCILACSAEGKRASPEFYFAYVSWPTLCSNGVWVERVDEKFHCHCIGCPNTPPSNTG